MLRPAILTAALLGVLSSSCAFGVYADLTQLRDGVELRQGVVAGLHYYEVTPDGYPEDAALPMVVFLHGRGDRPPLPDGPFLGLDMPVRVILPRAPEPFGSGYAWMPVSARTGESKALVRTIKRSANQVAQAIVQLQERHPTKGTPIVIGFSQGGMLAYRLATHHPNVVGTVFPLAAWLPPSLWPSGPRSDVEHPPIRAMHGTDDEILAISRTRHAVRTLNERGFLVELHEFDAQHRMTEPMRQQLKEWVRRAIQDRMGRGSDVPFA